MSETLLQHDIMKAVTETGGRLFRNNIGAWEWAPGMFVRYGVCNPGGSDLIGWTSTGKFLAVETKSVGGRTDKKRREQQENFIAQVNAAGGIGIIARSVEDVLEVLNGR